MSKVLASGNVRVLLHTNPPIPACFHWLLKIVAAGKPYCLCADPHYTTTSFFSSFSFPFLLLLIIFTGSIDQATLTVCPRRVIAPPFASPAAQQCVASRCDRTDLGIQWQAVAAVFFYFRPRRWLTYTFATFYLISLNDFIGFQPLTGSG